MTQQSEQTGTHTEWRTPGPWEIKVTERLGVGFQILGPLGSDERPNRKPIVCEVKPRHGGVRVDEANARLIAAAPDLLAAAKRLRAAKPSQAILPDDADWSEFQHALAETYAAIAAAEGGQP